MYKEKIDNIKFKEMKDRLKSKLQISTKKANRKLTKY